jgi:tetratricopeptide (TPR) repeat protein
MGELGAARLLLERAIHIYESSNGQTLVYQTAQDPSVACLSLLALVAWAQGAFETAKDYREKSLAVAARLNRPFDLAYAGCFAAMLDNARGEPSIAAETATMAIQIARDHGFGIWLLAGNMHLAIANGLLGNTSEAIDSLKSFLESWRTGGAELNRPFFLASLAKFCGEQGNMDEALVVIDNAIEHARIHDEHFYTALLYRVRGALLQKNGDPDAAWAAFKTALEIARQQAAQGFELLILQSISALPKGNSDEDQAVSGLQELSKEASESLVNSTTPR